MLAAINRSATQTFRSGGRGQTIQSFPAIDGIADFSDGNQLAGYIPPALCIRGKGKWPNASTVFHACAVRSVHGSQLFETGEFLSRARPP